MQRHQTRSAWFDERFKEIYRIQCRSELPVHSPDSPRVPGCLVCSHCIVSRRAKQAFHREGRRRQVQNDASHRRRTLSLRPPPPASPPLGSGERRTPGTWPAEEEGEGEGGVAIAAAAAWKSVIVHNLHLKDRFQM